jgi:hypothetical protein
MRRSTPFSKPRAASVLVCLVAFLSPTPSSGAAIGQHFSSVQAFVESFAQGRADVDKGYGELVGAGRRDWAAVVFLQDPEIGSAEQLVVLSQQPDGGYAVAAQGPVRSTNGGTAHHGLSRVLIKQRSVFVSWDWNWHGCGGGSTQQIRLYKGEWRVIGAEFNRAAAIQTPDGFEDGDSVRYSHNLLTGSAVMHLTPAGGKPGTLSSRLQPEHVLLDDAFDEETGEVPEFYTYARC